MNPNILKLDRKDDRSIVGDQIIVWKDNLVIASIVSNRSIVVRSHH